MTSNGQAYDLSFLSKLQKRLALAEGSADDVLWYPSDSPIMQRVIQQSQQLRKNSFSGSSPILGCVFGEKGVGKKAFVRMIHKNSQLSKGPWIVVACASLKAKDAQDAIFGSLVKGAMQPGFLHLAENGTIYFDQVHLLPATVQASLAQLLEHRSWGVMGHAQKFSLQCQFFVSVTLNTSEHLNSLFHEKLSAILEDFKIHLPNVEQRKDDILGFSEHYAHFVAACYGIKFEGFHEAFKNVLLQHAWKGNWQEIRSFIDLAFSVHHQGALQLPSFIAAKKPSEHHAASDGAHLSKEDNTQKALVSLKMSALPVGMGPSHDSLTYTQLKKQWSNALEQDYLINLLVKHQGNVSAAARSVKVDRSNFLRLLRKHKISASKYRKSGSQVA